MRTAAVVPASDPSKGQVPVAFVSLEPGERLHADELGAWARENMASYKVPLVRIVSEFPMAATGKIRKVELVDQAEKLADSIRG